MSSTRAIRASSAHASCDVCGRTLLRGERTAVYINGGARKDVCELCEPRVLHEGWTREGTVAAYSDDGGRSERRTSLLGRLRGRRSRPRVLSSVRPASPMTWMAALGQSTRRLHRVNRATCGQCRPAMSRRWPPRSRLFNESDHTRTVAGVARSLGAPTVTVLPSTQRPSQVEVVVSWELCWYRYEVDLSDDAPSVREAGRGYELAELTADEQQPTATSDERGSLHPIAV